MLNDCYTDHMDRKMTATEAKAKLLALLDDVAAGEVVEVTKHGRTVARLVPAVGPKAAPGMFAGVATSTADDDELLATGVDWDVV
jgi:prevent-host-death family protein